MSIALILAIGFIVFMGFVYADDEQTARNQQSNPKFRPEEKVVHRLTGAVCIILKQTTKNELDDYYSDVPHGHKPYSGYWVKVIESGQSFKWFPNSKTHEVSSLDFPVAESMLVRI